MYLVTKASNSYWYDFESENNIERLFKKYGSVVIDNNYNYKEKAEKVCEYWDSMVMQDAEKLVKCKYNIIIYDDYLE